MTREQSIRHETLLQLYGARPLAVSAEQAARRAARNGEDFTIREIESAILFFKSLGYCVEQLDAVTGEKRYQITAPGMLAWEGSYAK